MPNITLKRFMIFNSSDGCDESREGDKLLYHWTKEAPDGKVSLTEQIDDICLCDASINVSNRLNCDKFNKKANEEGTRPEQKNNDSDAEKPNPGEKHLSLVLTFDNTLVIIVLVEPRLSIWMAIHVSPPIPSESAEGTQPTRQQYQNDPSCLPTDAIERVMLNIYRRFCLLNGTFKMIADEVIGKTDEELRDEDDRMNSEKRRASIRDKLRTTCDTYFNSVLPEIHLNSMISNVACLYNYILYLDLNPLTLLKVNSFINHLVCIDASHISHTIVIFNDRLLWSSLNMLNTRILYNYMISILIRDALQEELSKEVDKVRRIKDNMPIYITEGTSSETNSKNSIKPDAASEVSATGASSTLIKSYLTVFRSSNNMTLGIILDEPDMFDLIEKCEQILTSDSRLGVIPLASLAQSVGQNFLRANSSSTGTHQPNQQATVSSFQQQQQAAGSSASSSSWRPTLGGSSQKGLAQLSEQKYVYMDRLYASITWPLSMDMQNKEHLLLTALDNNGVEIPANNKKLRLIRYLIDLEPELYDLKQLSDGGGLVEEFYARTLNDSWLTVTNSEYRTIYSVHNIRNSGLCEAKQSAINLRSSLANNRS